MVGQSSQDSPKERTHTLGAAAFLGAAGLVAFTALAALGAAAFLAAAGLGAAAFLAAGALALGAAFAFTALGFTTFAVTAGLAAWAAAFFAAFFAATASLKEFLGGAKRRHREQGGHAVTQSTPGAGVWEQQHPRGTGRDRDRAVTGATHLWLGWGSRVPFSTPAFSADRSTWRLYDSAGLFIMIHFSMAPWEEPVCRGQEGATNSNNTTGKGEGQKELHTSPQSSRSSVLAAALGQGGRTRER